MTLLGRLTFFQRVDMYAAALGGTNDVATALDLAAADLTNTEHRDLAARLAGAHDDVYGSTTMPVEATWDPLTAGAPTAQADVPDITMDQMLAPTDPGLTMPTPEPAAEGDVSMDQLMAVLGEPEAGA